MPILPRLLALFEHYSNKKEASALRLASRIDSRLSIVITLTKCLNTRLRTT